MNEKKVLDFILGEIFDRTNTGLWEFNNAQLDRDVIRGCLTDIRKLARMVRD